jgi:cellulose synthase/poly-beta-1,6-N-acetylglucosamine synthase-like glycosyltransferase
MMWLFCLLAFWFVLQLVYPVVTIALAQVWGKERLKTPAAPQQFDFACIITAYRNAAIAEPLVDSLLQQTHANLVIYVVADECPEIPFTRPDSRLVYLQPPVPLRLKAKSIRHAVQHFLRPHTHIVIFDADNLAHPTFLATINQYANAGFLCIQGRRTAKNLDTTYAALDALGEHYKNYLERQTPYLLGGSAVISGSGMATETALYKAYLYSPAIEQGQHQWKKMLQEDKILQNFVVGRGHTIAFARNAVVYDEKVDSGAAVETQRSRWLFSYFQNIPNALNLLAHGLLRFNRNQLYFGFVTLALPMFLQLAGAAVLLLVGCWLAPFWALALLVSMVLFALGIVWALHLDGAPAPVWRVLWQTPKFVFRQVLSLLKMRNPNKHFTHTEHKKPINLDDLLP